MRFLTWGKHRLVACSFFIDHMLCRLHGSCAQVEHLPATCWAANGCGRRRCKDCDELTPSKAELLRRCALVWQDAVRHQQGGA